MECNRQAETIAAAVEQMLQSRDRVIVAIDGRCGAGKTSLAKCLQERMDCNVIHMDDFFLRPEQRTRIRLAIPGGNVDYERFLDEVLKPLKAQKTVSYRPFCCSSQSLGDSITLEPQRVSIVEGSYSCHPTLWEYYDLHVFLSVDREEQMVRIFRRDPDKVEAFRQKWIPMEEKYFDAYAILRSCDLVLKT